MHDDDDLVGAEVAKLVLDREQRIRVSDLTFRREALLGGPGQRRLESFVRLLALTVESEAQ